MFLLLAEDLHFKLSSFQLWILYIYESNFRSSVPALDRNVIHYKPTLFIKSTCLN